MSAERADRPTAVATLEYVTIEEDAAGKLYLITGKRVYTGIEQFDPGDGPKLLLAAAMEDMAVTWKCPSEPLDNYCDPKTGDIIPIGEMVASYEEHSDPSYTDISIYPSSCGPAARRLFGLPALTNEK